MDVELHHTRRQVFDKHVAISMKFVASHLLSGSADIFGPAPAGIDQVPVLPGSYQTLRQAVVAEPEQGEVEMVADAISAHVGRLSSLDVCVPETYDSAKRSEEWHLWRLACNAELAALRDNDTYTLVTRTPDMDVLGSEWAFSIEDDGAFRAKMVAVTKRPMQGAVYEITSSPVPRYDALRLFFALAARQLFSVTHMKFNAAYFNIKLNDEMYVQPPPGFLLGGKKVDSSVLKLHKAVEGLARAPYGRDRTISRALKTLGFSPTGHGMCFYHKGTGPQSVLIAVSEEDLLIAAKDPEKIKQVKNKLVAKFHMRDLGTPKKLRGMNVECNEKHTNIHLGDYIDSLLRDYRMEDCTPLRIPTSGLSLCVGEDAAYSDVHAYRSLVAKLMYASLTVRFDIANIVRDLCRFLHSPTVKHWESAVNVVRYLKGTRTTGLMYDSNYKRSGMYCFTGSEDIDSRDGEFFGHVTIYAGSPVFWACSYVPILEGFGYGPQYSYGRGHPYDTLSDDFPLSSLHGDLYSEGEVSDVDEYFPFGFGTHKTNFGNTHGTTQAHRRALRAGVKQGAWATQVLLDLDMASFFNGYSADRENVRKVKKVAKNFKPKVRNSSGQYVTPPGITNEHLDVFHITDCIFTKETNPVELIVYKLCNEDHQKALSILSPPPSAADRQPLFRHMPDGSVRFGGNN